MEAFKILLSLLIDSFREHAQRARQSATVGASTMEYILMALLGISIAGLVAVAIKSWVDGKIGQLG